MHMMGSRLLHSVLVVLCTCAARAAVDLSSRDSDAIGAALHDGTLGVRELASGLDLDDAQHLEAAWRERTRQQQMAVGRDADAPACEAASAAAGQKTRCGAKEQCSCTCFCRGECLHSQEIPSELALFRGGAMHSVLRGDEHLENDGGALFLLLREMALPLLCRDEPTWRPCSRENRLVGVATFQRVHLKFGGKWGPYARCVAGKCELPDCAVCQARECEAKTEAVEENCAPKDVIPGRTSVSDRYARPLGTRCRRTDTRFADCDRPWEVWSWSLGRLLPTATLFSLPAGGRCSSSDPLAIAEGGDVPVPTASTNCTWQLLSAGKRVSVDCLRARLLDVLEHRNAVCFSGCSESGSSRFASECYIRCVYDTIFGNGTALVAMQEGELLQTWNSAFDNPSRGGCPGV